MGMLVWNKKKKKGGAPYLILFAVVSLLVVTWKGIVNINLPKELNNAGAKVHANIQIIQMLTGRPLISEPWRRSLALSAALRSY